MEGDDADRAALDALQISIHSLRMEGDRKLTDAEIAETVFQSTPSAWRETAHYSTAPESVRDFNPLPPHGGRLAAHIAS